MPANPLTPEQLADAAKLKGLFVAWQNKQKEFGNKISQENASAALGFGQSALSQYLNGKIPLNLDAASKIANLIGCQISSFSTSLSRQAEGYLLAHRHEMRRQLTADMVLDADTIEDSLPTSHDATGVVSNQESFVVPVLDVSASMGRGFLQPENDAIITRMTVTAAWIRRNVNVSRPECLALISAYGDSMEGTFNDGDLLLVDRCVNDIKIDAVYVLALNDELYIKRLQRRPDGSVLMISDNKKYEPYLIQNGEREKFQVLGRVLLAWNARKL